MSKTTASWNGQVIAASDHCIEVEGNAYFPPDSIDMKFFYCQFQHQRLPLERHGIIFRCLSGRQNQRWCRMGVPRSESGSCTDQRLCGVLERR